MATFKSDIEIARECEMRHIRDVATAAGIDEDLLEYYMENIKQSWILQH